MAAALGHGSFAVTARHYADPSTLQAVRTKTVLESIWPTPPSESPPQDLPPVDALPQGSPSEAALPDVATLAAQLRARLPKDAVIELAALLLQSLKG